MKFDENEMKLNLNERLREVRGNQKTKDFKEMIHYLLFFTQTSYARLKLAHNLYRKKIFLTRCVFNHVIK